MEELKEINKLIEFELYQLANKRVDALYERFTQGQITLTESQEQWLYSLINRISIAIYG